jgi:hypothetical protein
VTVKQTTRGIVDGKQVDYTPTREQMRAGAQLVVSFPAAESPAPGFAMVASMVPVTE